MKRAVARFIGCQGKVFLHLCAFEFCNIVRRSSIGRKVVIFKNFSSSKFYKIHLRNMKFHLKTGPHYFILKTGRHYLNLKAGLIFFS